MKHTLNLRPGTLAAALASCLPIFAAHAADAPAPLHLPQVQVNAPRAGVSEPHQLSAEALAPQTAATSDTAQLLRDIPGLSLYGAGGVSRLPAIHGLADDRLRIQVDGMDLISACANHMNPPLSYIDPTAVDSLQVFTGIAPVSAGGDSIGGTIRVNSAAPVFATPGQDRLTQGQIGTFFRSNGHGHGVNLSATLASDTLSLNYAGASAQSDDYHAARSFKAAGLAAADRAWLDGDVVGSSRYKTQNHQIGLALRKERHLFEAKVGVQDIAYQGFPNQRMDMTGNDSERINLRYQGRTDWGTVQARAWYEHTRHSMNFGEDKRFAYGDAPGMPMDTEGRNSGATVSADIDLSARDTLRVGGEALRYRLNDWWIASGTGMMMAPNTFWNIRNGQRNRLDVYAEWDARWSAQWVTQLGLRSGQVKLDTDRVEGYSTASYGNPALATSIPGAFNAAQRQRTDHNVDVTAQARYTPAAGQVFELGYGRKSRSPSLYERFTWASNNPMVMNMNNWVGDGNGYVGNLALRPEVAHTLSASARWSDAAQQRWELKVAPHYTHVEHYIDAVSCASVGKTCRTRSDGFLNLSLANQSARLYGVDVSGRMALGTLGGGALSGTGVLSIVKGRNQTTGDGLYNIMPANLKLALVHQWAGWTSTAEVHLVSAKTDTSQIRKEMTTPGYGLLNLRTRYTWKQLTLDLGIDNLLNKFYADPLGGAYLGQGSTMGQAVAWGTPVPGPGRSIHVGLSLKF